MVESHCRCNLRPHSFQNRLFFCYFHLKMLYTCNFEKPLLFWHVLNLQLEEKFTVTLSNTAWFPLIAAGYLHPATTASLLSHKEQKNEALFCSCTGTTSATACHNIHIITICHEENATGGTPCFDSSWHMYQQYRQAAKSTSCEKLHHTFPCVQYRSHASFR